MASVWKEGTVGKVCKGGKEGKVGKGGKVGVCYPSHKLISTLSYSLSPAVVIGLIAPACKAHARKTWNEIFRQRGIDAFFDFYRTNTDRDLELRLSEMFLHERRGYLIDPVFSLVIIPLLDRLDQSAILAGKVDTVVNEEGVFFGYFVDATLEDTQMDKRLSLFFPLDTNTP